MTQAKTDLSAALGELLVLQAYRVALILGWQDVRQAYRRSALGAWWITGGVAIQILTMGIVFSLIYKIEFREFLPFLSIGIVSWTFISYILNETCLSFINGEGIIKQMKFPLVMHVARVVWKNTIALGHNAIIIPVVFLICQQSVNANIFLGIPALILFFLNLSWMGFILAILTARYRDLLPIVNSMTSILLYVTPVMWLPTLIPTGLPSLLMGFNPFYHLIQIVRLPLLGMQPTLTNWAVLSVSCIIGWCMTIVLLSKTRNKITYWI